MYISLPLVLSAAAALLHMSAAAPAAEAGVNSTLLTHNKRVNLMDIWVGCNRDAHHNCRSRFTLVDVDQSQLMTCSRMALGAMANYKDTCDGFKTFTGCTDQREKPSIQRCCGEWISTNDPFSAGYPTMRHQKGTEMGSEVATLTGDQFEKLDALEHSLNVHHAADWVYRKVIKPEGWQYNSWDNVCYLWAPATEIQFQYWMQSLAQFGIDENFETMVSHV